MALNGTSDLLPRLRLDLTSLGVAEWDIALDMVGVEAFIHALTTAIFGSQIDDALLDQLRAFVGHPEARSRIVEVLLSSAEFRSRYGFWALARMPLDAFIRQTYRDVLGRNPDADGLTTYLRMGRKWQGRRRVLAAIRNSPEGRQAEGGRLARIAVLRRRLRHDRLGRIPLIGQWFGNLIERDRRIARLEVLVAAQIYSTGAAGAGTELIRQIAERLPGIAVGQCEPAAGELTADASPGQVEAWRFQDAVARARRRQAASSHL